MTLAARVSPPPHPLGQALRAAAATLRAEWTKFRTITGPFWLLAGVVALTVTVGAAAATAARCSSAACGLDPATVSFTGIYPAQAVAAVVGVVAIGNEYSTGLIKLSLTPWQGLGVVALWTAGAVLVGAIALKFRDA